MKSLTHREIFGNWATLLLAIDDHGNIDYSKLADEIDVLVASSPNGIYSNGTAGEFYAQTEDEFDRISLMLAEKCEKGGINYQIGVSHMSPQISLERLKRIKHLRPGAVQVILPDWFPVTLEEAVTFLLKMEEASNGINLVLYNPPHAKKQLICEDWSFLKKKIPSLVGLKVSDHNGDRNWYSSMKENADGLSVFIPGHRLATGIKNGAHGSYSNMACLNPFVAQKWYDLTQSDPAASVEMEKRVCQFMLTVINPLITKHHYPNHACDRFMALIGGWADIGSNLRWPYRSVDFRFVNSLRLKAISIIPEFFEIVY